MQDEQRTELLKQMLADHETCFGPDQWRDARSAPSKWAVEVIVRDVSRWDDRLQEFTHTQEFFLDAELRDAVCRRLGCDYESLSEELPDADPSIRFAGAYFGVLGLIMVVSVVIFVLKRIFAP
jgi:hypothetical protein